MGLLDKLRGGPKPGDVWEGPSCWTDDYSVVKQPGYYALTDDGKELRKPLVRLVGVAHSPDPDDDGHHLEVAGPNDPPHRFQEQGTNVISLESHTNGEGGVTG